MTFQYTVEPPTHSLCEFKRKITGCSLFEKAGLRWWCLSLGSLSEQMLFPSLVSTLSPTGWNVQGHLLAQFIPRCFFWEIIIGRCDNSILLALPGRGKGYISYTIGQENFFPGKNYFPRWGLVTNLRIPLPFSVTKSNMAAASKFR